MGSAWGRSRVHRFCVPAIAEVSCGRNMISWGLSRSGLPVVPPRTTTSCVTVDGPVDATVTFPSAASVGLINVPTSTSVRSHEPRLAVTTRQPSLLADICSGCTPSGATLVSGLARSRSTTFELLRSITDSSPRALLATNANVRRVMSNGGSNWPGLLHSYIGRPDTWGVPPASVPVPASAPPAGGTSSKPRHANAMSLGRSRLCTETGGGVVEQPTNASAASARAPSRIAPLIAAPGSGSRSVRSRGTASGCRRPDR